MTMKTKHNNRVHRQLEESVNGRKKTAKIRTFEKTELEKKSKLKPRKIIFEREQILAFFPETGTKKMRHK